MVDGRAKLRSDWSTGRVTRYAPPNWLAIVKLISEVQWRDCTRSRDYKQFEAIILNEETSNLCTGEVVVWGGVLHQFGATK